MGIMRLPIQICGEPIFITTEYMEKFEESADASVKPVPHISLHLPFRLDRKPGMT